MRSGSRATGDGAAAGAAAGAAPAGGAAPALVLPPLAGDWGAGVGGAAGLQAPASTAASKRPAMPGRSCLTAPRVRQTAHHKAISRGEAGARVTQALGSVKDDRARASRLVAVGGR